MELRAGGPVSYIARRFTSACGHEGPLDRRDLYNGFGDTLARAVEFVAAPVLFAFFGSILDRRFDLTPVLTISLLVLALAGSFARTWFGYVEAMKAEEAKGPWHTR